MARSTRRLQDCTPADARIRLAHARKYLEVADLVIGEESRENATVALGNAVLAAIAAADAICCATSGSRLRGQDHAVAAEHLGNVTGDKRLASLLRDVVNLKDLGHYGLGNVVVTRARSALRKVATTRRCGRRSREVTETAPPARR
jgi:hypothetical protein